MYTITLTTVADNDPLTLEAQYHNNHQEKMSIPTLQYTGIHLPEINSKFVYNLLNYVQMSLSAAVEQIQRNTAPRCCRLPAVT